jgi:type IV/VI secretion system ImpK/VasF family protein
MTSSSRLWFDIERVYGEIEALCVRERAADILLASRDGEDGSALRGAPRNSIPFDLETERFPKAELLLRDAAFRERHPNGADLVSLRSEARRRLVWLRSRLSEVLTEREVYYCLFPLVTYVDELVFAVAGPRATAYEPLQSELYGVDNAGELFYVTIDELLRKDETLPVIFEVYFFCLQDGFMGLYGGDTHKRDEYRNRLAARIPVSLPDKRPELAVSHAPVRLIPFPKWYYVGSIVLIACGFAALRVLGDFATELRALP